jgi:hypothetical protein
MFYLLHFIAIVWEILKIFSISNVVNAYTFIRKMMFFKKIQYTAQHLYNNYNIQILDYFKIDDILRIRILSKYFSINIPFF